MSYRDGLAYDIWHSVSCWCMYRRRISYYVVLLQRGGVVFVFLSFRILKFPHVTIFLMQR